MIYKSEDFDVAVIGAGHAGIEAALAAARLGCKTAMFTINMDWVGDMPCNPAIGGTAKGHLVREIDALGGQMGISADANYIQSRMLNRGKGPAVHSLRAQIDRRAYSAYMKQTVEKQENLDVYQAEITDLKRDETGLWHLTTKLLAEHTAKAVVLATGTFLGGRVYVGDVSYESGPDGMFPATELSLSLKELGLPLRRFKTGTPARVARKTVDLSILEEQPGDDDIVPFSFMTKDKGENKAVCHITWTNENTKKIILENLHRSPLYSGKIHGKGPRYCPSIEDKIVRFAEKQRHQVFIEPCGLNTDELYLQGLSSSLPEDVQLKILHTIKGLEHVKMMRTAYAIEYDCVDPLALSSTLEFLDFKGLYGAGQFNGSSGYEEAAAQGLVAGINAALEVLGKEPMILDRASSYIGTLVDDLVTKGCSDPYRMMTSRSEYRLVLRQDNADVRLTPIGRKAGLVNDERWAKFQKDQEMVKEEMNRIENLSIPMSDEINKLLQDVGTAPLKSGMKMAELMKRPEVTYKLLESIDTNRPLLPDYIFEKVEVEVKYQGYIKRQMAQIEEMRRLENKLLPIDVDYNTVNGLRLEAAEKINKLRPRSIGQASRISGVSPADISVLIIWLQTRTMTESSNVVADTDNTSK